MTTIAGLCLNGDLEMQSFYIIHDASSPCGMESSRGFRQKEIQIFRFRRLSGCIEFFLQEG